MRGRLGTTHTIGVFDLTICNPGDTVSTKRAHLPTKFGTDAEYLQATGFSECRKPEFGSRIESKSRIVQTPILSGMMRTGQCFCTANANALVSRRLQPAAGCELNSGKCQDEF
ncbi:hypothetical protein MKZ38_004812 [Zalerion maritima]|uniref:Uncharacterized protein n=1 Tax=Zalerion maritima TaxID=339359 RepID=A0AAD5WQU0_9PEZI|nr:hypothetical protein MKZ38_004812 [Zalerion maritima]